MNDQNTQLASRRKRKATVKGYDNEVVTQIIQSMATSASGVDTYLFSYGPFDNDDSRSFNCHLCWATNLYGLNNVRKHLKSERHSKNLKRIPAITHFKLPLTVSYKHDGETVNKYFKIYAGENIEHPDLHYDQCFSKEILWFLIGVDECISKILLEDPLNDISKLKTIIGVNFLGKMANSTGQIQYFCFLCEEKLKIEDNEAHFRSMEHEMKYIKEYFPLAYEKILSCFNFLKEEHEVHAAVCEFFRNIYHELEVEHGFQSVSVVNETDFNNNFIRLSSKILSIDHYGELYSDYSEKRVAAYIQKLLEAPELYKEIKPPADFIADTTFLMKDEIIAEELPPPNKKLQTDEIHSFISKFELQKFTDKEVETVKARYKSLENDPKSFRSYSEEWNKFYQSRRTELEKEGINLTTYNFQKDFKEYWKNRCEELMSDAIKEKMAKIESGECRPTSKANLTESRVTSPVTGNAFRKESVQSSISTGALMPAPPIWRGIGQAAVNTAKPTHIVETNVKPICNIPQLLLEIENFMGSLSPAILQLIIHANTFKQGLDQNNIAAYAVLCKKIELCLAAHLADVKNFQIFKHTIMNLNALVNTQNLEQSKNSDAAPKNGEAHGKNRSVVVARSDSQPDLNPKNSDNGTNEPDNSSLKSGVTSLRPTTNPMFDFERKTYGKVEAKEERTGEDYTDDDNVSISSRKSVYKGQEKTSQSNFSPLSKSIYKSSFRGMRGNNQFTRQNIDEDGRISGSSRNNMNNFPNERTASIWKSDTYLGYNSTPVENRDQRNMYSPFNRLNNYSRRNY